MSDSSKGSDKPATTNNDAPAPGKKRRRPSGSKLKAGSNVVRSKIASVIWLVAVVCALFLAVGALLIALNANQENNSLVTFILDGADFLDPFSRDNGVFTFDGKDAETKNALVDWGIAAMVYLIIGKVLDRIIRP